MKFITVLSLLFSFFSFQMTTFANNDATGAAENKEKKECHCKKKKCKKCKQDRKHCKCKKKHRHDKKRRHRKAQQLRKEAKDT